LSSFGQGDAGSLSSAICHIPFSQSVINIDGDVSGCVYAKAHHLGNMVNNNYADIWFGKRYDEFRKGYSCHQRCLGKAVYPLLNLGE